jgi:putative ABC transport system permease protein
VGLVTNNHYWVVRSSGDSQSLETAFRREVQSIDRDAATSSVRTLEDYLSDSVALRKFNLRVLTVFSISALLLAATGLYGIVSYTVTQRIPEIGVRLALGAGSARVFRLILSQGLKLVLIGVGLGMIGAFAVTRVIRSLLFGVDANDPLTFVFVSMLLTLVALIACIVPARRATKVDPLIALRSE